METITCNCKAAAEEQAAKGAERIAPVEVDEKTGAVHVVTPGGERLRIK